METSNLKTKATQGIHATMETGWAIGTSIAGTIVLFRQILRLDSSLT